jgi:parvulin-like peptidyl-prolyl isomerase
MLKSSSSQISNQNFNNRIDCEYSSNLNHEDDQIKLKNKLKTMDRSNPLFRRMFLKLMRIQMNENKLNNQRNQILSTPPPSSIQFNNQNSNLDFDIQTILHFEQTTFGDDIFDIQDLPNL